MKSCSSGTHKLNVNNNFDYRYYSKQMYKNKLLIITQIESHNQQENVWYRTSRRGAILLEAILYISVVFSKIPSQFGMTIFKVFRRCVSKTLLSIFEWSFCIELDSLVIKTQSMLTSHG